MISAGAHVKAVQRALGHASAAITLDVSAGLFDDDLEALADAVDEQFGDVDATGAAHVRPKPSVEVVEFIRRADEM